MAICRWQGDVSSDPTVGGNWSTGVVPAVNDDVIFDGTAQSAPTGDDMSGVQVDTLTFAEDYAYDTATWAAPLEFDVEFAVDIRCAGTHYLTIDNSTQINVNGAATVYLRGLDNDKLNVDATGAIAEVGDRAGAVAMEFDAAEISAGTVTFWEWESKAAAAPVLLTVHGGTVKTYEAITVARQDGGVWTHFEGASTVLHLAGGTCRYNSDGAVATFVYLEGGQLDLSRGWRAVTIAATEVRAGSSLVDPNGRVTWTAAPEFHNCSFDDTTVDFGFHKKYTVAAI